MLRKNHPATAVRELSLEKFAALSYLEISSTHHATDFIDQVLARRKLKRRIVLRAPFLSAVRILAASDMVSVLPKRIAEELVRYRPLAIRSLSQISQTIETAVIWPRRLEGQPSDRWLRNAVMATADEIRSQ